MCVVKAPDEPEAPHLCHLYLSRLGASCFTSISSRPRSPRSRFGTPTCRPIRIASLNQEEKTSLSFAAALQARRYKPRAIDEAARRARTLAANGSPGAASAGLVVVMACQIRTWSLNNVE